MVLMGGKGVLDFKIPPDKEIIFLNGNIASISHNFGALDLKNFPSMFEKSNKIR